MHGRVQEVTSVIFVITVGLVRVIMFQEVKAAPKVYQVQLCRVCLVEAHVLEFEIRVDVVQRVQCLDSVHELQHETVEEPFV